MSLRDCLYLLGVMVLIFAAEITGHLASAIGIVPIFVEVHRETDSVLESLAASLCIILLAWLLFAAFVGIIVFPYYFITVLLR